jgi:hypothetical protein
MAFSCGARSASDLNEKDYFPPLEISINYELVFRQRAVSFVSQAIRDNADALQLRRAISIQREGTRLLNSRLSRRQLQAVRCI